jgi:hypothetical protein
MFEISISACHLWGRGLIPGQTHSSIERATLSDSVGFLRGLQFPPTLHYKSPNIVYRANDVLVDAQLSIQYFFTIVSINVLLRYYKLPFRFRYIDKRFHMYVLHI